MDDVQRYISVLCDMQHKGGRCVHRGTDTLLVYDVFRWTDDMTQQLKQHFPYCVADVTASSSSLSGFVVNLSHRPQSTANAVLVVILVTLLSSFMLAQHIVHRFAGVTS